MLVTLSGITMSVRESQPENAISPMAVRLSGSMTSASDPQRANVSYFISTTRSGIVMLVKDVQLKKTRPINARHALRNDETRKRFAGNRNAPLPMLAPAAGMLISERGAVGKRNFVSLRRPEYGRL